MKLKPIKDFQKFIDKDVLPAIVDLQSLDDRNRIHIQKLVYTNLVDRFDSMADLTILDNCREEFLMNASLRDMTGSITESELIKLLLNVDSLQDALDLKLKKSLRNNLLNKRHSLKLKSLFELITPNLNVMSPRVNPMNGQILEQIRPINNQQPHSLCGYADWLYSRRNSIVHGGGANKYLLNDKNQLKNLYKCSPPETFQIKLSSVQNAVTFYKGVTEILLGHST